MPDVRSLSTGVKLALGASILLLLDTFFAWQSVDLPEPFGDVSQSAWHGFWGVVLGLLTIAFIAWLVARVLDVALPELPVRAQHITLALGVLIFAFALIKNLVDDYSAWASYVGIVLAALVAIGAWLISQEAEEARESAASYATETPAPASASPPTGAEPTPPPAAPQSPPSASEEPPGPSEPAAGS